MALTLVSASCYKMGECKINTVFPKIFKHLGVPAMDKKATTFFSDVIKKTYNQRIQTEERRNDIIDILVYEINTFSSKNLKQQDTFESEFEKYAAIDTTDIKDIDLDIETLWLPMLFFLAGIETTDLG